MPTLRAAPESNSRTFLSVITLLINYLKACMVLALELALVVLITHDKYTINDRVH